MGNYSAPLVLLIKALCQVEGEKRVTCKELAEWLSKYENSIIELQEFNIGELPEKLHKLSQSQSGSKVQGGSKVQQAPPPIPQQLPYQYQGQFMPQIPPTNFISAPVNRSEIKYTEQSVVKPGYIPQQYVPPAPYTYSQDFGSVAYGGSGSGVARGQFEYQQPVPRSNINLQQIDEQLQMSRKLFPS